jgi:hypothetical protein
VAAKPPAKKPAKKPAPNTPAPAGSYALPKGGPGGADAYPINTPGRARSALSRASANATPAEQAKIRGAVKRKYPDIGQGSSKAAPKAAPKKK